MELVRNGFDRSLVCSSKLRANDEGTYLRDNGVKPCLVFLGMEGLQFCKVSAQAGEFS